jgi:hypothetical protein
MSCERIHILMTLERKSECSGVIGEKVLNAEGEKTRKYGGGGGDGSHSHHLLLLHAFIVQMSMTTFALVSSCEFIFFEKFYTLLLSTSNQHYGFV